MHETKLGRRPLLAGLGLSAVAGGLAACSTTQESRDDSVARAEAAREDLFRQIPAARDLAERSAGYLIFPSVTQGAFIFGGQFGNGVLFEGGRPTGFYNITGGLAMLISRFWLAVPTLALAGALARKKLVPAGPGTLATHTPLFVALLIGVIIMVGAMTFLPALALGPIIEHLLL